MALGKQTPKDGLARSDATGRAAASSGLTRRQVEQAVAVVSQMVESELAQRGAVRIKALGTFTVKLRAPRVGRHPITGEALAIPERKTVQFKPAKNLVQNQG